MIRLLLVMTILLVIATPTVVAEIQVIPADIGTTYIQWSWMPAGDVTNILIDGNEVCGYETTSGTYFLSGLGPGELHTIAVYNATDSGYGTATTIGATWSSGSYEGIGILFGIVGGLLGAIVIYRRDKL